MYNSAKCLTTILLATWLAFGYSIGDICARLTENRFALGELAVHNWRYLRPANEKVPKSLFDKLFGSEPLTLEPFSDDNPQPASALESFTPREWEYS
ncbi:hypothetical protein AVEN_205277-1 [Araneus ventricosus]|uniref:Uncharacterized protein n=1 Tax=Araneus ventricosus TaxID=182803 RepID=A0A4Y2UDI6_ARAVE|nr:hypothetical protein AVEN_205277-1 [Araneus ventricosus]